MTSQSVSVVPIVSSPKRAMSSQDEIPEENESLEHGPSKCVKREMLDYSALELDQLKLEDNGLDKKGNRRLRPLLGDSLLHCNLTPLGFQVTPFGFDVSGKFQKPSFLSNQPPQRSEGLNLPVIFRITRESSFLREVDFFFKSKLAEMDDKLKWHSLESMSDYDASDVYRTKVKVVLAGERLTEIKIIDHNIGIHTGVGWEFLQSHLEAFNNFRWARVKVAVCLSDLWCVDGKAGLTLTATHLVLTFPKLAPGKKPTDKEPFHDVFENDFILSELAAE